MITSIRLADRPQKLRHLAGRREEREISPVSHLPMVRTSAPASRPPRSMARSLPVDRAAGDHEHCAGRSTTPGAPPLLDTLHGVSRWVRRSRAPPSRSGLLTFIMNDSPARIDPEEAAIGRQTQTARRLVEASVSPNTRRAYAGALRRLDAWLDGRALDLRVVARGDGGPREPRARRTALSSADFLDQRRIEVSHLRVLRVRVQNIHPPLDVKERVLAA